MYGSKFDKFFLTMLIYDLNCRIQKDIVLSLRLKKPSTTISSFDRPNFFYGVKRLADTLVLKELTKEVLR